MKNFTKPHRKHIKPQKRQLNYHLNNSIRTLKLVCNINKDIINYRNNNSIINKTTTTTVATKTSTTPATSNNNSINKRLQRSPLRVQASQRIPQSNNNVFQASFFIMHNNNSNNNKILVIIHFIPAINKKFYIVAKQRHQQLQKQTTISSTMTSTTSTTHCINIFIITCYQLSRNQKHSDKFQSFKTKQKQENNQFEIKINFYTKITLHNKLLKTIFKFS